MSGWRQGWLVARRELRERSRSPALWFGTVLMLGLVVVAIVVPAVLEDDHVTADVGFTGETPAGLPEAVIGQGDAVDVTVRVHRYDGTEAGEDAVRADDVDVLVVDGRELVWRGGADEQLRAVVTGAIQVLAVQDRAAAAGIDPDVLAQLSAPVPVGNRELGTTAGRSPDDEAAAYAMSVLLLIAVATYGQLVLTGVVQEKSSRVVEVLLARMPARNLLAGKVAGIGLLGLAQFAVTAVAALIATVAVESVDIPAISGDVLLWVVVWFVLGYAMYAVAYGAFGSLASRTEDASSIAAPVTTLLLVGYWASLFAMGDDPEGVGAQVASLVPVTAPFAMPGRIALGAAAWWEQLLSVALAGAAIAGLAVVAGRVYTRAILHTGARTRLRDVWRRAGTTEATETRSNPMDRSSASATTLIALAAAAAVGGAVALTTSDVVIGVGAGAAVFAVVSRASSARARHR